MTERQPERQRREAPKGPGRGHEYVLLGMAVLIAVVWATATLVQVVFPGHVVPTEVHFVMMSVSAFFFGGSVFSAWRGGNGKNGKGGE